MAYLDTAFAFGAAGAPEVLLEPGLSDLEGRVVRLARRDGLATLRAPSRARRFAAWAFGLSVAQPLADERMEALRRFAVLAARRRVGDAARIALGAHGYSLTQIGEAERWATGFSAGNGRPSFGGTRAAGNAALWLGAFLWIRVGLGNSVLTTLAAAYYGLSSPRSAH